jgi:hypothetical protein
MAVNPSSFHQEFEQFAPIVLLKGARIAFKVVPSLRNSVVNMIAGLLQKLLGRWIPKQIGDVAYRPLASMLLRLMGLEASAPNPGLQERVFAEALANTATEALLNAGNLPQSILEGDQQVLESELESIVQQAVLNNFPQEALEGNVPQVIRKPRGAPNFLPRRGHQVLSRPVRVMLTASQISSIRVRGSVLLSDFLRRYYKWDGRSPLTLDIVVFRTTPGRGRISRILKGYFGQGRPIRLTPYHFRQLHPMSRRTARIIKMPGIWSRATPTFFIIRNASPASRGVGGGIGSPQLAIPTPSTVSRAPIRGNDIRVGVDSMSRLRASLYLNDETVRGLKSLAGNAINRGLRAVLTRIVTSGQTWLTNLLSRLRIPRALGRAVAHLLIKLIERYLTKAASNLVQRINALANRPGGITITLSIQLPKDIVRTLQRITPLQIPSLIATLVRSPFSLIVSAGYNM